MCRSSSSDAVVIFNWAIVIVGMSLALACLTLAEASAVPRMSLATRNDAAPKGCKWQRITDTTSSSSSSSSSSSLTSPSSSADHHQQQQLQQQQSHRLSNVGGGSSSAAAEHSMKHLLTCKLRTLSSIDALIGNLSVYQTDRISTLRLECSDVLFFESSLEASGNGGAGGGGSGGGGHHAQFLGSLRNLRELNIDYCKIRNVPSMVLKELRDLRALSIRTHNSDWRNVMSMELHPESFRGLTELLALDLGDNNIWSVPTEVFCPLFSLRTLNLTQNRLSDVAQLGFADWKTMAAAANGGSAAIGSGNGALPSLGKACNTGLETLDLSHNHIQKVPDNGLSALQSLQSLLLQENQLTAVMDRALVGLTALRVLNMSSNRLIALPPDVFQPVRGLQQLHLQNNTLTVLAPGLLTGLERLEVLDLSQNRLVGASWNDRSTFGGLIRLVVLNLGYNDIARIDQHVFGGLYSLQILNLEQNAIETIDSMAFADLKNLHALTLSNNRLKNLDTFALSELYVLNQLFLDGNQIGTLADRVFENLTNLNDLSLNDNRLTSVPRGIRKLSFLKSLDLGKNRIETIAKSNFEGLDNLLGLRLVDNQLANITKDTFRALGSVHVINLASNHIRHIDQSAFAGNPTLRAIRLDHNRLEDISGVFTALPNLVWLNVSDNQLRWFDYSHLPSSLEWLDMHRNNITELGNYFDMRNQLQIKMLDVSYNRLQRIDEASVPDSIETLFVNNNQLADVAVGTFLTKRNIEKVVLYGNRIRTLDIGAFALQPVADNRDMPIFYLGDNPIHCDCHMEWLQRINELSHLRQHPRVLDLDLVQCTLEHERGEVVRPLMDLQSHDFLCPYESQCSAQCHCCDFDACDCKMTCPDRCSCYHDHAWTANVVDCGQAEYTEVPERIPMDATAIYLDGNNLGHLTGHAFIGKRRLESLYLNASHVRTVHNRTFNGVPVLRRLHLQNNGLEELRDNEFEQLTRLAELQLEGNAIERVGERTFAALRSLEVLRLAGNRIAEFEPWTQLGAAIGGGSLAHVSMAGVKWKCGCASLVRLENWIAQLSEGGDFDARQQLVCVDGRPVVEVLRGCVRTTTPMTSVASASNSAAASSAAGKTSSTSDGNPSNGSGGQSNVRDSNADSENNIAGTSNELIATEYVPLLLAGAVVLLVCVALLFAIGCAFRQPLRLFLHARYGLRLLSDPTTIQPNADDNEKLYDAYLVYSIRDDNYVTQIVAPELQGYNICLHHRDIPASTTYLNDSLQSAADASKKLVIVVSMNFLQHEWSQPQFRLALQKCIENIAPAQRGRKLVLILTAPLEIIAIDPIMQVLMQKCPVVSLGEKRFWDKLRYALPDVQQPRGVGKKVGGGGGGVNVTCNPGLRYTPAPINMDVWSKARSSSAATAATAASSASLVAIPMTERLHSRSAVVPTSTAGMPALSAMSAITAALAAQQHQQQLQHQQQQQQHMQMHAHQLPGLVASHQQQLEEESSSCASSQHYAVAPVQNYMCRSSASSLGHVYSTIPETPTGNPAGAGGDRRPDGPAYFV